MPDTSANLSDLTLPTSVQRTLALSATVARAASWGAHGIAPRRPLFALDLGEGLARRYAARSDAGSWSATLASRYAIASSDIARSEWPLARRSQGQPSSPVSRAPAWRWSDPAPAAASTVERSFASDLMSHGWDVQGAASSEPGRSVEPSPELSRDVESARLAEASLPTAPTPVPGAPPDRALVQRTADDLPVQEAPVPTNVAQSAEPTAEQEHLTPVADLPAAPTQRMPELAALLLTTLNRALPLVQPEIRDPLARMGYRTPDLRGAAQSSAGASQVQRTLPLAQPPSQPASQVARAATTSTQPVQPSVSSFPPAAARPVAASAARNVESSPLAAPQSPVSTNSPGGEAAPAALDAPLGAPQNEPFAARAVDPAQPARSDTSPAASTVALSVSDSATAALSDVASVATDTAASAPLAYPGAFASGIARRFDAPAQRAAATPLTIRTWPAGSSVSATSVSQAPQHSAVARTAAPLARSAPVDAGQQRGITTAPQTMSRTATLDVTALAGASWSPATPVNPAMEAPGAASERTFASVQRTSAPEHAMAPDRDAASTWMRSPVLPVLPHAEAGSAAVTRQADSAAAPISLDFSALPLASSITRRPTLGADVFHPIAVRDAEAALPAGASDVVYETPPAAIGQNEAMTGHAPQELGAAASGEMPLVRRAADAASNRAAGGSPIAWAASSASPLTPLGDTITWSAAAQGPVQREVAPLETSTPASAAAQPPGQPGAAPGASGGASMEQLARQVYDYLRRELLIEHERSGRRAW